MQSSDFSAKEKLRTFLSPRLTDKRVVILGFAREGQSTYRLLRSFFPSLPILILDREAPSDHKIKSLLLEDGNVKSDFSSTYLSHFCGTDIIFKTPGIPSLLVEIQDAVTKGAYLTSQTDVFFSLFGSQIIAVTGTKGKSTASKVISHVLEVLGRKTLFIGNIGRPAFDALERLTTDTDIVYETSSHQCEGLRVGPHVGVFLNLFQDHLDYYVSQASYGEAKLQLFIHQKPEDVCIYHVADVNVSRLLTTIPAKKYGYSLHKMSGSITYVSQGWVVTTLRGFEEAIIETKEIPLLGEHNILNILPSVIIATLRGVKADELKKALRSATPVEKRLETVGIVGGITFVDDALATIPEATIAAVKALGNNVQTLIVGGFDRGQDFSSLATVIAASSIEHLLFFPTTGEKIADAVRVRTQKVKMHPVKNMKDAVGIARMVTHPGKTVLLSTASASFGLFADYRDRSRQYEDAIRKSEE